VNLYDRNSARRPPLKGIEIRFVDERAKRNAHFRECPLKVLVKIGRHHGLHQPRPSAFGRIVMDGVVDIGVHHSEQLEVLHAYPFHHHLCLVIRREGVLLSFGLDVAQDIAPNPVRQVVRRHPIPERVQDGIVQVEPTRQ